MNVYQLWIQDQPYPTPNNINPRTRNGNPDRMLAQNFELAAAHSKWMLTIDTTAHNGYLITHSITKIPLDLYPNPNNFGQNPSIFNNDFWGRFKLSQHIYCTNLPDQNSLTQVINAIGQMYPPIAHANFAAAHLRNIPNGAYLQPLHTHITQLINQPTAYGGRIFWSGKRCYKKYVHHFDLDSAFEQCLKPSWIYNLPSILTIYQHAPLPRIYSQAANAITMPTKWLGPDPWLAVANFEGDTLLLFHFRTEYNAGAHYYGSGLPHVRQYDESIREVTRRTVAIVVNNVAYSRTWDMDLTHDKIAVGVERNTICIGDSNRDYKQIHHAGITICFESRNLVNFIRTWAVGHLDIKTGALGGASPILPLPMTHDTFTITANIRALISLPTAAKRPAQRNNNNNNDPEIYSRRNAHFNARPSDLRSHYAPIESPMEEFDYPAEPAFFEEMQPELPEEAFEFN
eukprot:TRINITY_DN3611_c0_g1_i5.p1 TRINITY_DN3611_c0_g1~~TRINITY_DN3611_c0_g1_i5.p1  ORF type:complete len:458 (-),score=-1.23 TRINITY_DN3611_c0_g1_i5:43-1416(-)